MLNRLDHLVILVRDLDQAVREYEVLGFTVTPAGPVAEHANGATCISRLELAASNERAATRSLAALVGAPDVRAGSFRVGNCTLSLAVGQEPGARRRLDAVGLAPLRPGSRPEKGVRRGGWTGGSPKGPAYGYSRGRRRPGFDGGLKPHSPWRDNMGARRRWS